MPFDQSEPLEPVEKLADARSRHAEATCQIELVDGGARARVIAQHPLHKPLLDLSRKRLGLGNGKTSRARGALGGSHYAMRSASTNDAPTGQLRQHLAHRRTADTQPRLEGVLRRQPLAVAKHSNQLEGVVEGAFENSIGPHAALQQLSCLLIYKKQIDQSARLLTFIEKEQTEDWGINVREARGRQGDSTFKSARAGPIASRPICDATNSSATENRGTA